MHGRHVIHQLAEDFRSKTMKFDKQLWKDVEQLTYRGLGDGLTVATTGSRPPNATVLAMVTKQPWHARGCQPRHQIEVVESLLASRADPYITRDRGTTILMDMRGAGNTNMLKYFYQSILDGEDRDLVRTENYDGRNLYSISGLADEDERRERPHVELDCLLMVQHLFKLEILPEGSRGKSGAKLELRWVIARMLIDVAGLSKHMYILKYMYIYTYIHIYIHYTYIYVHTYGMYVCACVSMYACIHVCMYNACMYVYC